MSSVDEAGTVYDLSGQGRHLTSVGSMSFGRTENNFPMVDFADSYLERADEPGLDCTNFTVGGWFRMKTTVDEEIRLLDKTNFCLKIRNTLGRVENIVRLVLQRKVDRKPLQTALAVRKIGRVISALIVTNHANSS